MHTVEYQIYAFSTMALAGAALALLFDLLRIMRWRLGAGEALTALSDFVYWGLATVVLAGSFVLGTWGELRLYVPLGLAVGAVAYVALGRPVTMALLVLASALVEGIMGLAWRVVWRPLFSVGQFIAGALVRALAVPGRWLLRRGAVMVPPVVIRGWQRLAGWFLRSSPDQPAQED